MFLVVSLRPSLVRVQFLGQDSGVQAAHFEAGGTGLAALRTLQQLEAPVRLLSCQGAELGAIYAHRLADEGLDARFLQVASPTPLELRQFRPEEGRPARGFAEEPMQLSGEEMRALLDALQAELYDCKGLLLAGPGPSAGSDFLFAEMIRRARRVDVPVLLIGRGLSLLEAVPAGPQWLVTSRAGFARSLAAAALPEEGFLADLFSAGCRGLVLPDGAGPVRIVTAEGRRSFAPPPSAERGERGASEALAAAMLLRLVEGWDLQPAVCYGIAAATARRSHRVGGRLSASEVEGFYRQVRAAGESLEV